MIVRRNILIQQIFSHKSYSLRGKCKGRRAYYGLVSKKRIFFVKKSIFFKNRESGLKTFWGGKQDPQAGPNTLVIISWRFKEDWKNRFFDEKNGIFEFQPLWAGKQKTHFFGQKIDFFSKTVKVVLKPFERGNKTPKPHQIH